MTNAESLAVLSDAELKAMGVKKGTRIKITKWQSSLIAEGTDYSAALKAPPGGGGGGGSGGNDDNYAAQTALAALVTKAGLPEATFEKLQSAGVGSIDQLRALDAGGLAATGLKRGHSLKLQIALAALDAP